MLQIFPVPRRGLSGYLLAHLYFRPEGMRAYLNLGTSVELEDGSRDHWYEPLSGRGPLDRGGVEQNDRSAALVDGAFSEIALDSLGLLRGKFC